MTQTEFRIRKCSNRIVVSVVNYGRMAANKTIFRSVTFPKYEYTEKKMSGPLQRMRSADLSTEVNSRRQLSEDGLLSSTQGSQKSMKSNRSRGVSAQGHVKMQHFQHAHSTSCTPSPRTRSCRSTDGRLCGSVGRSTHEVDSRSVGNLQSSKFRGEELPLDWRARDRRHCSHDRSLRHRRSRSVQRRSERSRHRSQLCASVSLPPLSKGFPEYTQSPTTPPVQPASPDTRGRLSHLRRALSLFSMSCDKEVGKSPQRRILRPPTKHLYRKGVSGLPIKCSPNRIGLVY